MKHSGSIPTDRFDANVRVVIIRRFFHEAAAHLYKAALAKEGIDSFLSNARMTTMIPMLAGGFHLHVREDEAERAHTIIRQVEQRMAYSPDGDYRNADLDDIRYEKEVWEHERRLAKAYADRLFPKIIAALLGLIILALIVQWLKG